MNGRWDGGVSRTGSKGTGGRTYLSLKAFRIRSTSISRWNAVASLASSLSMSSAEGFEELAVGCGVDDDASDMAYAGMKEAQRYLSQ